MGSSSDDSATRQQKENNSVQKVQCKPLPGLNIVVIVSILIACILIAITLFTFGWQHACLIFVCILFVWGFLLAGLGLMYLFRPSGLVVRLGKYELNEPTVGTVLLILALATMCFATYLAVGVVDTQYHGDKEKLILPANQKTLNKVEELYENAQYDDCINLLDKVRANDDDVLEEVQYYTIMARYHKYEVDNRRYRDLTVEDIQRLGIAFKTFMDERLNSKRFDTVQYWLGHLYLQLRNDRESALQVFDEIIDQYFHSNWIQGSLYYSAILHYAKNTPADKERAIKQLRALSKMGGLLRIVELGRDFGAAGCAKELLERWGVTAKPKDEDVSKTCANSSQDKQSVLSTDSQEIKSE